MGSGLNASVNNSGTSTSAILNFSIPQGPTGPAGSGNDILPLNNTFTGTNIFLGNTTINALNTTNQITGFNKCVFTNISTNIVYS